MRTAQLVTQFIQAVLFAGIAVRTYTDWSRERGRREASLAIATGLFAASSLIGAVTTALYDPAKLEQAPRAVSVLSGSLTIASIFAFFVFLTEFVPMPGWVKGLALLATLFVLVMNVIEQPDLRFDPQRGLVPIPGVDNLIGYRTWIGIVLGFFAVGFGLLWVAFLVYGVRVKGLARFRMLSISGGFFLLFAVIGLLPRLLFGDPSAETIQDVINVALYVALASAPLLFMGFAPPRWVTERFDRPAEERPAAPVASG